MKAVSTWNTFKHSIKFIIKKWGKMGKYVFITERE